jgi:hypothetical protein
MTARACSYQFHLRHLTFSKVLSVLLSPTHRLMYTEENCEDIKLTSVKGVSAITEKVALNAINPCSSIQQAAENEIL